MSVDLEQLLDPWRQELFAKMPKTEGHLQIAYKALQPALPKLRSVCRSAVRPDIYTVAIFDAHMQPLCMRLSNLLPPNEYWDAQSSRIQKTDFVSILNAGWLFTLNWLTPQPGLTEHLETEVKRQRSIGLIEYALEMVELDEIWTEVQKGGHAD